ncbi:MAG: site-specific integrase [Candidatus Hodarchaeota archaeon]
MDSEGWSGWLPEQREIRIRLFPERDNLKERILSEDEEKKLLLTSSELVKSAITVAINTGLRLREILNLKWDQINFNARTIKVENAKNGRIRYVDVNTPLLRELQMLRSRDGQSPYVFFNPETGKPYLDTKKGFKAACRRAGIEGLRFYDLRHTFVSRLAERGVYLITVKDLLGHSTVKMTERYTHSSRQSKRNAVELLTQRES